MRSSYADLVLTLLLTILVINTNATGPNVCKSIVVSSYTTVTKQETYTSIVPDDTNRCCMLWTCNRACTVTRTIVLTRTVTMQVPVTNEVEVCCTNFAKDSIGLCNKKMCDPSCANGGTCGTDSKCTCPAGYQGAFCEDVENLCKVGKHDCQQKCQDIPGNYTCTCNRGYILISRTDCDKQCGFDGNGCYPGYCNLTQIASSCRCATGFRGDKCLNIATLPIIDGGYATFKDSSDKAVEKVPCANGKNSGIRFNSSTQLDFKITARFRPDWPFKPSFIALVKIGIINVTVQMQLLRGGVPTSLQSKQIIPLLNKTDARDTVDVTASFDLSLGLQDHDRFEITVTAENGGYIDVIEPVKGDIIRNFYTGVKAEWNTTIIVSMLKPFNCKQSADCRGKPCASCVPLLVDNDATTQNPVSISWDGWEPDDIGIPISSYNYSLYAMQYEPAGWKETLPPIKTESLGNQPKGTKTIALPASGFYSVVLKVTDIGGKVSCSRQLILYDNEVSNVTRNWGALYVASALASTAYQWSADVYPLDVEQSTISPIEVRWDGAFSQPKHINNHWLEKVQPYDCEGQEIPYTLDDHSGKRTVDPVPNTDGIVKFEKNDDVINTDGTDYSNKFYNNELNQWVDTMSQQTEWNAKLRRENGQTYFIAVRASDIFGRSEKLFNMTHYQGESPVIDQPLTTPIPFEKVNSREYNITDAAGSLSVNIYDIYAPFTSLYWKIVQINHTLHSTVVKEATITSETLGSNACSKETSDCNCPKTKGGTSYPPCYMKKYLIDARFNEFKTEDAHDKFMIHITVVGKTGLVSSLSQQLWEPGSPQDQFTTPKTVQVGAIVGGVFGALGFIIIVALIVLVINRLQTISTGLGGILAGRKTADNEYMRLADKIGLANSDISVGDELYHGKYAGIYDGGIIREGFPSRCAVLKLYDGQSDDIIKSFGHVVEFYRTLSPHEHVVSLIANTTNPREPYILLEFCQLGKLSKWLRDEGRKTQAGFMLDKPIKMSMDISRGMQYLADSKVYHGSLRAGKVLLTVNMNAKVTGFAPSVIASTDPPDERFAINWMAPEKMNNPRLRDEKSDVWSFSMLLWEIFTFGQKPFEHVSHRDLPSAIKNDVRPECPEGCPQFIHGLMESGWQYDETRRPPFAEFNRVFEEHYIEGKEDDYYKRIYATNSMMMDKQEQSHV